MVKIIKGPTITGLNELAKKASQSDLDRALVLAAKLGADEEIRVLALNGAQATEKAYLAALNMGQYKGEGGHALAALYVKGLIEKTVNPQVPLTKLKMSS